MAENQVPKLNPKKRYLQIALNSTLTEAERVISKLPRNDRIIIEAGTPLIKRHGQQGISTIKARFAQHLGMFSPNATPYVVADMKMMDRGSTEVDIAYQGGASACTALGSAPPEALNAFVARCQQLGLDAMIDMMHVDFPLTVLRQLKILPACVILHRGVDEEQFNKEIQIPLHEIRRVKSNYDMMIAVAGGDEIRDVQRAIFNDADIVVVWKQFYQSGSDTASLAEEFLREIK